MSCFFGLQTRKSFICMFCFFPLHKTAFCSTLSDKNNALQLTEWHTSENNKQYNYNLFIKNKCVRARGTNCAQELQAIFITDNNTNFPCRKWAKIKELWHENRFKFKKKKKRAVRMTPFEECSARAMPTTQQCT